MVSVEMLRKILSLLGRGVGSWVLPCPPGAVPRRSVGTAPEKQEGWGSPHLGSILGCFLHLTSAARGDAADPAALAHESELSAPPVLEIIHQQKAPEVLGLVARLILGEHACMGTVT